MLDQPEKEEEQFVNLLFEQISNNYYKQSKFEGSKYWFSEPIDEADILGSCENNSTMFFLHWNNFLGYIPIDTEDFLSLLPTQFPTTICVNALGEYINENYSNALYLNTLLLDIFKLEKYEDQLHYYSYQNVNFNNVDRIMLPVVSHDDENGEYISQLLVFNKHDDQYKFFQFHFYNSENNWTIARKFYQFVSIMLQRNKIWNETIEDYFYQVDKCTNLYHKCDCNVYCMYLLNLLCSPTKNSIINDVNIHFMDFVLAYQFRYKFYKFFIQQNRKCNKVQLSGQMSCDQLEKLGETEFNRYQNYFVTYCKNFYGYICNNALTGQYLIQLKYNRLELLAYLMKINLPNRVNNSWKELIGNNFKYPPVIDHSRIVSKTVFKEQVNTLYNTVQREWIDMVNYYNKLILKTLYQGNEQEQLNLLDQRIKRMLDRHLAELFINSNNNQIFNSSKNRNTNSFRTYLQMSKESDVESFLKKVGCVFLIDFEAHLAEGPLILLSEFTIARVSYDSSLRRFNYIPIYYHHLVNYDRITINEGLKKRVEKNNNSPIPPPIEKFDKLTIEDGINPPLNLDYNYIKSICHIYSNVTRLPLINEYEREEMMEMVPSLIINRKDVANKIVEIIGDKDAICFAKGIDMECKIMHMLSKESKKQMPQVFELFDLLELKGISKDNRLFNSSIKQSQLERYRDDCCDYHLTVEIELYDRIKDKKTLAHCSLRDVKSYVNAMYPNM